MRPRPLDHDHVRIGRPATPADWDGARALIGDYLDWVVAALGLADAAEVQACTATERADPRSAFDRPGHALLLGRVGRLPAGILGLRPGERAGDAELTRFYVRPVARGTGLGRRLLDATLHEAVALGADRVVLDTLPGLMDAAIRQYEAAGFRRTDAPPHVDLPGAVRFELDLAERAREVA